MPTRLPGSPRSVSHEVLNATSAVRLLSVPGAMPAGTPGADPSAEVLPRRFISAATCVDGRSDNPLVWNPGRMVAIVASFC